MCLDARIKDAVMGAGHKVGSAVLGLAECLKGAPSCVENRKMGMCRKNQIGHESALALRDRIEWLRRPDLATPERLQIM